MLQIARWSVVIEQHMSARRGTATPMDVEWALAQGRFSILQARPITALPPQAEPLAASEFCPIAMYHIGSHVFAMQAHPEFSREYSRDLMEVRRGLIGDERIAEHEARAARRRQALDGVSHEQPRDAQHGPIRPAPGRRARTRRRLLHHLSAGQCRLAHRRRPRDARRGAVVVQVDQLGEVIGDDFGSKHEFSLRSKSQSLKSEGLIPRCLSNFPFSFFPSSAGPFSPPD